MSALDCKGLARGLLGRIPSTLLGAILLSGSTTFACSSGSGDAFFGSNRPPVAISKSITTVAGAPFAGFLEARDDDDDELTFTIVTPPVVGALELIDSSTGQFRYESDVVGTDSFAFRVSDGRSNSNLGTVSVTVTAALAMQRAAVSAGAPVSSMPAVDPYDPSHWISIRAGRLFESLDAGGRWSRVAPVGLDPQRDRALFVAFVEGVAGLFYLAVLANDGDGVLLLRRRYSGDDWSMLARVPADGTIALAASALDADRIRLELRSGAGRWSWVGFDRPHAGGRPSAP